MTTINFDAIREELTKARQRSAWDRGVYAFACDLVDDMEWSAEYYDRPANAKQLEKIMLNGADNWTHYAWNGCGLCYNYQIAQALCTPSELKKKRNGALQPNSREEWLDVYARAMYQAAQKVKTAYASAVGYDF